MSFLLLPKDVVTDHGVTVRFAPWSVDCGNTHMLTIPNRQVSSLRTIQGIIDFVLAASP